MALIGRRKSKLEEVYAQIGKEDTIVLTADVLDEKSVFNLKEKLVEFTNGHLDLLVNNVGGVPAMGPLEKMSLEQWQQVMDKNLTSAFLITKAFLQTCIKAKMLH